MKKFLLIFILLFFSWFNPLNAGDEKSDFAFISIAKSGTGLAAQCIKLITHKKRYYTPTLQRLRAMTANNFIGTHFCHVKVVEQLLQMPQAEKLIINIRDPRSILVSAAFYYKDYQYIDFSKPSDINPLFPFNNMPIKKRIKIYLQKALQGQYIPTPIYDIKKAIATIKELQQANKNFFLVRYEDLVGHQGGGEKAKQLEIIQRLSYFLTDKNLSDEEIQKISNSIYGHTSTFREGQVDHWQPYFDEDMKKMCKALLGQEIIDLGYEKDDQW